MVKRGKLLLGGSKGANVGLPGFGIKVSALIVILLRPWIIIAFKQHVISWAWNLRSVCSFDIAEAFVVRANVGTWSNKSILVIYKGIFCNLCICWPKILHNLRFPFNIAKVTLLENVLMCAWLYPTLNKLLFHKVLFFLLLVFFLCFWGKLSHQFIEVLLALLLVVQGFLLVDDTPHHFHADRFLLLIVVSGAWHFGGLIKLLRMITSFAAILTPRTSWGSFSCDHNARVILSRPNSTILLPWSHRGLLLGRRLLDLKLREVLKLWLTLLGALHVALLVGDSLCIVLLEACRQIHLVLVGLLRHHDLRHLLAVNHIWRRNGPISCMRLMTHHELLLDELVILWVVVGCPEGVLKLSASLDDCHRV